MKRFSIWVRERGASAEVELCQCDGNPEAIADAARAKFLMVSAGVSSRKVREAKFEHVRVVENKNAP